MTDTCFSNIVNSVAYQHRLGQLGKTRISEALSLIVFQITLLMQENGGEQ